MKAEIITDVTSYRREVERYAALTGTSLKEAMEESVAILAGTLARKFPPKSLAQGRKAIRNDLKRIFTPVDKNIVAEWEMNEGLGIYTNQTGHVFKTKTGAIYAVDGELHRPNASMREMNAHHLKYRDSRGRVTRAGSRTRDIGRWRFVDKMHVKTSTFNAYVKFVSESVGSLKSGWALATYRFKGAKELPGWIRRHASDNGRVIDAMKKNGNGYIEIVNEIPYASRWAPINASVVSSQKRMFKKRIYYELKKQAKEFERRSK